MFLDSSKVRFGFRYGLRWGIFTNKKTCHLAKNDGRFNFSFKVEWWQLPSKCSGLHLSAGTAATALGLGQNSMGLGHFLGQSMVDIPN